MGKETTFLLSPWGSKGFKEIKIDVGIATS
jgi:hypothetical protein